MSNRLCDISRQSAKRFIALCLSLHETQLWFHQSLTFGEDVVEFREAKEHLNIFFDAFEKEIQKELDVATVYIMGRQGNGRVHFHLIFFCYPPQSISAE